MKRLALATLLLATPALSRAQQADTKTRLDNAISLYEAFNVEAARPILLQIISPGYLQQVTPEQRATAYKYLGASYAVLASPDTATQYFIAALDFDPFTDLDPSKFAQSELEAFTRAKAQIFKVAVRPMEGPALLKPQPNVSVDSAAYTFSFISTQRSNMRITLQHTTPQYPTNRPRVQSDSAPDQVLYSGTNEGVRTVQWRGVLADGSFAPPGTYSLIVAATSTQSASGGEQRQSLVFRLEHLLEPLEDTLPTLDPNNPAQLLPTSYKPLSIWQDLIKGAFVGTVAGVALPIVAGDDIKTLPHALGATAFVIGGAGVSFLYRRRDPRIQVNVAENQRRQAVRTTFNQLVQRRNNARKEQTVMVITPVTAAQ